MISGWLGSQGLSEIGIALVGIGSILSLFELLNDSDKKRVLPLAITSIAFGSVLTLAPQYEEAGSSAYWAVIAVLAAVASVFALISLLRWLVRRREPRSVEGEDGEDEYEQPKRPIGPDVDTEIDGNQHPTTVGPGTLTADEKSLASAAMTIAVGLVLLAKGLRSLTNR